MENSNKQYRSQYLYLNKKVVICFPGAESSLVVILQIITATVFTMHQSIPVVPILPGQPRGIILLTLSVPGVGHAQFYRGPGAGHLRTCF